MFQPRQPIRLDDSVSKLAIAAPQALRNCHSLLALRPLLIVSDFDGTLSPIVLDPWAANMLPLARRALRQLAGRDAVAVALLSGRTAADLAGRARIGGASYFGNHGVECGRLTRRQRAATILVVEPEVSPRSQEAVERLAREVPALVKAAWLVVERKGSAVSLHFRAAPDTDVAEQRVNEAVEHLDPEHVLMRFPGRCVLELRPAGATTKGDTMLQLLREYEPRVAFVLGDDVSDAEAFRVLTAWRAPGRRDGAALAVQARDEVPAGVTEAADLVLASPFEAARFLAGLARTKSAALRLS